MGLLGKLFGKETAYPELDSSVPEYGTVQSYKKHLEKFAENISSDMEVLPFENRLFIFIGNPPRNFGLAWIEDTYMYNLKGVVKEKGISPSEFQKISEELRAAYERHKDSINKYTLQLPNTLAVINSSRALGEEVSAIISKV